MNKRGIFCIIPAFNEETSVVGVVEDVLNYVDRVVVVDDGSLDNTASKLDFVRQKHKNRVVVLKHPFNLGQGAALETGAAYLRNCNEEVRAVVHFDADGQFIPQEIASLVKPILQKEAEVVLGSRFLEKKSRIPWFKEKVILRLARWFNRIFLGIKFSDPQSGFRAFSGQILQDLKISQNGMAHCSEILAKIAQAKWRVKEVPITVIYRHFGQGLGGGFAIIRDLLWAKLLYWSEK